VSGLCLYYATRGTDWTTVGRLLASADPLWVLAVGAVSVLCHALRAQRWRILLRPVVHAPYGPALSATLIGFAASMVLPLRLGEIVRPALFARRVRIPLTPAVASIVIERLLDMLLVLGCFVVVTGAYPQLAAYRAMALGLGAGGGGLLAMLYLMARNRDRADAWFERLATRLPLRAQRVLRPIVHGVLDGARGLGDGRTLVLMLIFSAVLWGLIVQTYLLSFLALDLRVPLVAASLATVVVVAAFVFLPQAPGFVGTWQAACVLSLGLFGVPKEQAVGYSLLTWVIQMVVNVGAGGIAAAFQDLSVRQLVQAPEGDAAEAPAETR
jgi:uncharacterized protein (TIRG00374 family)